MDNIGAEEGHIAVQPKYEVTLPMREQIIWPQKCSLCTTAHHSSTITVQDTFESANYAVARKKTTLKFKNVPICEDCKKKTSFSIGQAIMIVLGLVLGGAVFMSVVLIDDAYFCGACLGGIGVILLFFLLATFAMRHKVEAQPVTLKVETDGETLGNKRPVKMVFKFRNSKYMEEFAALNTDQEMPDLRW